jgi:Tol biopolymer transport system component
VARRIGRSDICLRALDFLRIGSTLCQMDGRSFAKLVAAATVLLVLAAVLVPGAEAAYPGKDGPIAYSFLHIEEGEDSGGLLTHGPRLKEKPRVLSEGAEDRAPAYSANGRLVAFEGQRDPGEPQGTHIYVMRADGSGVRRLTTGGTFYDSDPTFSPDGKKIVFGRSPVNSSRASHLFEVPVSGGEPTQLTSGSGHDSEAVFTSNGHTILFVSDRRRASRDDIYSMRPSGTDVKLLLGGSRNETSPDVSPDGREVLFTSSSDRGGATNLFLAPIDGKARHPITHRRRNCIMSSCIASPAFSPDGTHIAFLEFGRSSSDLQVMRTDGRGHAKEFDEAGTEEEGFGSRIGAPAWGRLPG